MKKGYLSQYFEGVAFKRVSAVDSQPSSSNQHEIGTTKAMRKSFLGEKKERFPTRFIWFQGEQETVTEDGILTHYDTRENQPKRSPEWRLYYTSNAVTNLMSAGDSLFLAKPTGDHSLLFIVTEQGSTAESQLCWLFGIDEQIGMKFDAFDTSGNRDYQIDFTTRFILEEIGIELEDPNSNSIDEVIRKFGDNFPGTAEFSEHARLTLPGVDARENPDLAIMLWLDHEDRMFKRLEQQIIEKRLGTGFTDKVGKPDVEGFLKFAGSVRQRRFSRMGLSLEHHLQAVFQVHGLTFERTAVTENKTKPDFLFPGQNEYFDPAFPDSKLVMLGSKSTCKDRWRQVLSEAKRIKNKHLFTLEPSISENQTAEMQANLLQLVVPKKIHASYKSTQQRWLMSLSNFVKFVADKQ